MCISLIAIMCANTHLWSTRVWHVLTRDHTALPATHTFICIWNEPLCLYPPAAEHHRTLAGTHFPSRLEQEAELAWVARWNTEAVCLPENGHSVPSIRGGGRESNLRQSSRKSNAIKTRLTSHRRFRRLSELGSPTFRGPKPQAPSDIKEKKLYTL